jgi:hypothetical protein
VWPTASASSDWRKPQAFRAAVIRTPSTFGEGNFIARASARSPGRLGRMVFSISVLSVPELEGFVKKKIAGKQKSLHAGYANKTLIAIGT